MKKALEGNELFMDQIKSDRDKSDIDYIFLSDTYGFNINLGSPCETVIGEILEAEKKPTVKEPQGQRIRNYQASDLLRPSGTFSVTCPKIISRLYDTKKFNVCSLGEETIKDALKKDGRFKEQYIEPDNIRLVRKQDNGDVSLSYNASQYWKEEFTIVNKGISYSSQEPSASSSGYDPRENHSFPTEQRETSSASLSETNENHSELTERLTLPQDTLKHIYMEIKQVDHKKFNSMKVFKSKNREKLVLTKSIRNVLSGLFQQECSGGRGISMSCKFVTILDNRMKSVESFMQETIKEL